MSTGMIQASRAIAYETKELHDLRYARMLGIRNIYDPTENRLHLQAVLF